MAEEQPTSPADPQAQTATPQENSTAEAAAPAESAPAEPTAADAGANDQADIDELLKQAAFEDPPEVGVGAAVVRSVGMGLAIIARQLFPHRVFATVDQALGWMAPRMAAGGAGPTASELVHAVAQMRERHKKQFAPNTRAPLIGANVR